MQTIQQVFTEADLLIKLSKRVSKVLLKYVLLRSVPKFVQLSKWRRERDFPSQSQIRKDRQRRRRRHKRRAAIYFFLQSHDDDDSPLTLISYTYMFLRSFHVYALFDWVKEYTGGRGSNMGQCKFPTYNTTVLFAQTLFDFIILPFSPITCFFWQHAACLVSNARRNLFFNFKREKIYVSQDTFKMPLLYNFSPGKIVFSNSNKLYFATDFDVFVELLYFFKKITLRITVLTSNSGKHSTAAH